MEFSGGMFTPWIAALSPVAALLLVAALLPACEGPGLGALDPLPDPDRALFAAEAGPLLEKRCADVSCHGVDGRPFVLYATGRRRLDPADNFLPTPLEPEEVDANYDAVRGFLDADAPRRTTLLRKALGAMGHGGGAVFAHPTDPEMRALEAWVAQ